jgi:uncharacterized Zn finger protein
MSGYYGDFDQPSVAERRHRAEAAKGRLTRKGEKLEPVTILGRAIAETFWGKAWCKNLESYSDYENRLPRGRSYVRNGAVIDLKIAPGKVNALVQGTRLYKIVIQIEPLSPRRWESFKQAAAGKVTNLLDLLQGKLSKDILLEITAKGSGLFPAPSEISMKCSCPDSAGLCKHLAAVLYGVGTRLDAQPELFFTLRGVDMQDLIVAASAGASAPMTEVDEAGALAGADLSELFGIEIDTESGEAAPAHKAKRQATKKAPAKTRAVKNKKR